MQLEMIESFVERHGALKAADLLGVTNQYLYATLRKKRSVVVKKVGNRHEAFDIAPYGARHHTPLPKKRAARRIAESLVGASA